ncbi:MAG: hypothetical protein AABY22_31195 [Nanoarchaeota archaeon]
MINKKIKELSRCLVCGINIIVPRYGIAFNRYKSRRYCSTKCWYLRFGVRKNVCPQCKKEFRVGNRLTKSTKKYCSRICQGKYAIREFNPRWKGGKFKARGYIWIRDKNGQYRAEHRIVMEEILKRKLKRYEHVHHKNGVKDDNRKSNLAVVLLNNHFGKVNCPKCKYRFLIK